jgi:hypothetical protein
VVDERVAPAYEPDRVSAEAIFALGSLLIFGVGIVMWALWIMGQNRVPPSAVTQVLPRAEDSLWMARSPRVTREFPLLQTDPAADLRAFRAREDSVLEGYGWADRAAGKARVPVERAMEMWVKRTGAGP